MTSANPRNDMHPRIHGSFVVGETGKTGVDLAAALRATEHARAICEPRPAAQHTPDERHDL